MRSKALSDVKFAASSHPKPTLRIAKYRGVITGAIASGGRSSTLMKRRRLTFEITSDNDPYRKE